MNNNLNNDINNNQTPHNQIGSTPPPDFNTIFGLPPDPEPVQEVQPVQSQPVQSPETAPSVKTSETIEPTPPQNQLSQTTTTDNNNQTPNIKTQNQPIETPINNPISPSPEINNQSLPNSTDSETPLNTTPNNPNDIPSNTIEYQTDYINDETLLRAFIGNNYEKITTQPFNIAGFFFTGFYMLYRKMFLYALVFILANTIITAIINSSIISLIICVLVGLFVNKIYLSFAKEKIINIKATHPNSTPEELRAICTNKGGTSFLTVILGLFAEIIITIIIVMVSISLGLGNFLKDFVNPLEWNVTYEEDTQNKDDGNLVEDITIDGHICSDSDCTITITDKNNNSTDYTSKSIDTEYIELLENYKDYIKVNIYYTEKNITSIKVYIKESNEDISSIKDENSLRERLGLFSLGTHTETLTLTKIGSPGTGFSNNNSYTYVSYTFTDSKNNQYEMKYINQPSTLKLKESQKYKVTFEVIKGTFDVEYNIKSIK